MPSLPHRNENKFKQFAKNMKLNRMTNLHVNNCACHHFLIYYHNNIYVQHVNSMKLKHN